jgi:hypothetical protein
MTNGRGGARPTEPGARLVFNTYRDAHRRREGLQALIEGATEAAELATLTGLREIEDARAMAAARALTTLWNVEVGAARARSGEAEPARRVTPEPPGAQGSASRRRGSARPRGGRAGSVEAA